MTDTPPPGAADAAPAGSTLTDAPKDSSAQMIVALAIVGGIAVIATGALWVALACKTEVGTVAACMTVVGTCAGILGNALTAPTGISSVIASARKPGATQ